VLELRDYQTVLLEQARAQIRAGVHQLLIQSPTGSGKTVLVAKMLQNASSRGYHSWFNVHRRELVKQSVMTLTESAGLDVGIVAAGFPSNRHLPCQVCSIGTLRQRRSLLGKPRLIIWDECHHLAAGSWAEIFEAYPDAAHIGLTATPERLDGTGLGKWFKSLIIGPSVSWLIKNGYLSDYRMFAPPPPNLEGVHTIAGDFNRKELSQAMTASSVMGDVISHYKKHAPGRRMVLFAWSIDASMSLAERFRQAGIPAEHVDGDTDATTRDGAMDRFKRGDIKVLTNVDLFGEGVDVPAIEAVAMLRPTQSLTLYLQQIGRGLRMFPGKEYAVILDHAGNCRRFGMPDDERTWTLEGRKKRSTPNDAAPIRQCPRCFCVSSAAADSCRACGFKFLIVGRGVEEIEGTLQEVDSIEARKMKRDAEQREQAQAETLDDLIKLGKFRGYKNPEKWAHKIYSFRQAKKAARDAQRFASGMGPFKII
jgi:DNA repair protein RadD